MTRPTQGSGGPDGRPLCFNGTAPTHYVANDGYSEDGRLLSRRIPWAFSTGCKSWASDPSTDPVPMAEGWKCHGCRHLLPNLVVEAFARQALREARADLEARK